MNLVIFMKEQQLDALLENINYEISLLSNASAFIKQVYILGWFLPLPR